MKKIRFILILILHVLFFNGALAQIQVIPRPQQIVIENEGFILSSKTVIVADQSIQKEAEYLDTIFRYAFSQKTAINTKGEGIHLKLNPQLRARLGDEGYLLKVNQKEIVIEGATNAGVFYGIQTLRQLLPSDFEFFPDSHKTALVKGVAIEDRPRFQWRAFMLDESRHFKGTEVVKELLDQMAQLKMNVFHWHLTDDQGWRIEIKKYPKLTSVGGYRKDTQTVKHGEERAGVSHGGFYTQEEIREIIDYASERHIEIVPEIEMPGHAMAAIAGLSVAGSTWNYYRGSRNFWENG